MEPEPDAWQIWYFQREQGDVPAQEFLDSLSKAVRNHFLAVLNSIADGPPPRFRGGAYWQAMHDEMAGLYEIRKRAGDTNLRLICLLDRPGRDRGGPSIICLGGFSKPLREAAHPRDYERILRFRDEFLETRAAVN